MKLSLSNGIFSRLSLEKNFEAVVNLGFKNLEFNMKSVKKENDTDVYREQRLLAATDLKCLTLHSASLHVEDPLEVHRAVYYGKISLECAHALGAPLMTVHSNVSKKLSRQVREKCLEAIFGEINPFAKSLGVKLALENLSYTSTGFGKNVDQLEEVLGVIDPAGEMGITFDLCHALETGEVDNLLEKYGRRVCNVHMADKDHRPFLESSPRLEGFLGGLRDCGYGGPITLELAHGTQVEEILESKALFSKVLHNY
jgi:sugar phosphate isomerase/epimerase